MESNRLYFGDCLQVMRDHLPDESVDLVYLDPPFNSKRDYNLLFKTPKGHHTDAQITAFEDSWHWGDQAMGEFRDLVKDGPSAIATLMEALRSILGENDLAAYLVMMASRLKECYRVLKPTGSLYLHCDPAASHYLKLVLDGIFGKGNFRNEIVWRRTGSHNSAKKYGPVHDIVFFYTKTDDYTWNRVYRPYTSKYVREFFTKGDQRGRFRSQTLTGSGIRKGDSGKPWRGYDPTSKGRHWAFPGHLADEFGISNLTLQEKLDFLYEEGLIAPKEVDGLPEYRQYLEGSPGVLLQDIWAYQPHTNLVLFATGECIDEDVKWVEKRGGEERLGYPTQKPVGLLRRIILSSSHPGDVVLDPFCGCGTTVCAAQELERRWIGMDITHLAISLIEKRLRDAFPYSKFEVLGTPKDLESAVELARRDKYQFQWWACSLINAQPFGGKKKGADRGIDGLIFFQDEPDSSLVKKIIVSVKGGENLSPSMIRDLIGTVEKEKAAMGFFVTLTPPTNAMRREAAVAGFYESPLDKPFPRIQILTVEGLLGGVEKPNYPDWTFGELTFRKARRAPKKREQRRLLDHLLDGSGEPDI